MVFNLRIPYPHFEDITIGLDNSKLFAISFIFSECIFLSSYLVKTTHTFDLSTSSSPRTVQQLEYFILMSCISSEESMRSKIRSAPSDSSNVDLNASNI